MKETRLFWLMILEAGKSKSMDPGILLIFREGLMVIPFMVEGRGTHVKEHESLLCFITTCACSNQPSPVTARIQLHEKGIISLS